MQNDRKCSLYYCSLHKWMLAAYSIEILGNYSVTCWDSFWSHLPWKTGQNLLFITQHNCRAGCITEVGEIAEIPILTRKYSCTSCTNCRFTEISSMHFIIRSSFHHMCNTALSINILSPIIKHNAVLISAFSWVEMPSQLLIKICLRFISL